MSGIDIQMNSAGEVGAQAAESGAATEVGEVQPPDGGIVLNSETPEDVEVAIYKVTVHVDGGKKEITVSNDGKTVKSVLDEAGVELSEKDKLEGAKADDVLSGDLVLTVKRITHKYITDEETIPAKTIYKDNPSLSKDTTNILKEGAAGKKKLEYKIVFEDGKQIEKKLINETVVKAALDRVIERGTGGIVKLPDGTELKYKKIIDVKLTAYTKSYEDTGKRPGDPGFGKTKSGMDAQYGVVAVDPKVIPLGTKMYISVLDDGIPDYGYCVAGDTGGKIKGNKVDLYFDADRETLLEFGRRNGRVYILE
jgi:3D (Asp-Asp-Asp) domain-containing protein